MTKIVSIVVLAIACIGGAVNGQVEGDECLKAMQAFLGSNSFDTTNATPSSPEPDDSQCAQTFLDWGGSNDLWFTFTPTTTEDFSFSTCDVDSYDTSIVLYKQSCDNQVACNGDSSTGETCQIYYSTIIYPLEAGIEYFVRIGGYLGATGPGTLTISDSGGGGDLGACCIDIGQGKYYCYESIQAECDGGQWTKGADCDSITCGSTTWYVDATNGNPGDGKSWVQAFVDLQDALSVAASGDEIWIAQGWYVPSDTAGSNDSREASYRLIAGVNIYGGFNGTETDVDERQPDLYQVHFSGDLNGNDGKGGDSSENAYHVVVADNLTGLSPILDGVYISGGNADDVAPNRSGAGLKIMNYGVGSAAFPLVYQTTFTNNSAVQGGAVAVSNQHGGITLIGCVLANNSVTTKGGAVSNNGTIVVESCFLVSNTADENGGAVSNNNGSVSLENCLIAHNSAEMRGGAMYQNGDSLLVVNCTIVQNIAGLAGAIQAQEGITTASNNIIWGNVEINGSNAQIRRENGNWDFNYNCIQSIGTEIGGKGNIETNPRFFNELGDDEIPATGDERFQLMQQSPCIDAGDTTVVTVLYDLDGNTRVVDDPYTVDTGNNPTGGPVVDMGAYEIFVGANNLAIWSGANSNMFGDPENWLPSGVPDIEDTAMFDLLGAKFVQITQSRYLNSLYITKGDITFDISDTVLTLFSQTDPLRVTPFDAPTSATFKGEGGILRVTGPLNLQEGNISFIEGATFEAPNVELGEGFEFFLDGTFVGNLTNIGSRVLPGGHDIGVINIEGNLSHQGQDVPNGLPVGVLSFDIAGRNAGDFDKMSIKGHADMTSAIELRWDPGYTPIAGDSYDLITSNTASGNPTVVYCTGLPPRLSCRWASPGNGIRGSGSEVVVETTGPILFDSGTSTAISMTPNAFVVGDLDGINGDDVAMTFPDAGGGAGSVVILFNNGMSGGVWQGFTESSPITVGIDPRDIEVGDFNNDKSALDLVVANYGDDNVSVLSNDGSGSFTKLDISTDSQPVFIVIGDYVEDGPTDPVMVDIVVACDSYSATVLENESTPGLRGVSFNNVNSFAIPEPADLDPGDVNNDKDLDYACLNGATEEIRIIQGNGDGTVVIPPIGVVYGEALPNGSAPTELEFADLNADGYQDAITVNSGTDSLSILLGGATELGSASTVGVLSAGSNPESMTVHDFDNDGDDDFVLSAIGSGSGLMTTHRVLKVVRNDSAGTVVVLSEGVETGSGSEPVAVEHGDFDEDGLEDLVSIIDLAPLQGQNSPAIGVFLNITEVVVACPGDADGDGTITVADILAIIGAWGSTTDPEIDVDGSGIVDVGDVLLVVANWGSC